MGGVAWGSAIAVGPHSSSLASPARVAFRYLATKVNRSALSRMVTASALCPGPVDTPLLRELYAADPEQAARRMVHVPMGRFAQAEEIANAALFLASDESSYVNATAFLVDGGITGAYTTP